METPEIPNRQLPEQSGSEINPMFPISDSNRLPSHIEQSPVQPQQQVPGYDMGPHIVGMENMLSPEQVQAQMMQQQQPNPDLWPVNNNASNDLDMEVNWEAWDAMVRDYQMQVDNEQEGPDGRGLALGGMGQGW